MRKLGSLPEKLQIKGKRYEIRSDFRDCLRIQDAFADERLRHEEALECMRRILYPAWREMPPDHIEEAVREGLNFLNAGRTQKEGRKSPLYSWEQDEQMIMASLAKVTGKDVRSMPYLHWWTFLGLFGEITDGLFSQVTEIRRKLRDGEKLEKHERKFYRENKALIEIRRKRSEAEQANIDRLNKILG